MIKVFIISALIFMLSNVAYLIVAYFINDYFPFKIESSRNYVIKSVSKILFPLLFVYPFFYDKYTLRSRNNKILYSSLLLSVSIIFLINLLFREGNISLIAFSYFLICIAFIDYYSFIIPDLLLLLLLLIASYKGYVIKENVIQNFSASILIGIFFFSIKRIGKFIFAKDLIGYGDIKLIVVLSFFYGVLLFSIGLWLSALLAILITSVVSFFGKKHNLKERIPFGFYLGSVFSILSFADITLINIFYKLVGV